MFSKAASRENGSATSTHTKLAKNRKISAKHSSCSDFRNSSETYFQFVNLKNIQIVLIDNSSRKHHFDCFMTLYTFKCVHYLYTFKCVHKCVQIPPSVYTSVYKILYTSKCVHRCVQDRVCTHLNVYTSVYTTLYTSVYK